jgi:hypothetical protein
VSTRNIQHTRSGREQREHRSVLLLLCIIALCAGCNISDQKDQGPPSPTSELATALASAFATVEAEVMFDLAFPTYMPSGFELGSWDYAPADSPIATPGTPIIRHLYLFYQREPSLIEIRQSSGFNDVPSASDVTPGTGTPVAIDDIPGETVIFNKDGESVAMVAWVDQDVVYQVLSPSTQVVSMDELLLIAESMTHD